MNDIKIWVIDHRDERALLYLQFLRTFDWGIVIIVNNIHANYRNDMIFVTTNIKIWIIRHYKLFGILCTYNYQNYLYAQVEDNYGNKITIINSTSVWS